MSSNGNIFHVTGSLWGESTCYWWIPLTKASDAELWCFLWSVPEQTHEQTLETPVIWDAILFTMTLLYCLCKLWQIIGRLMGSDHSFVVGCVKAYNLKRTCCSGGQYMYWGHFTNTHPLSKVSAVALTIAYLQMKSMGTKALNQLQWLDKD